MPKTTTAKKVSTNSSQVLTWKTPGQANTSCPGSGAYEIRVKDHLETYWFEWFEGWSITNLENGKVLLVSGAVDQSMLHGTLNKIRDLNLTLLSVKLVKENHIRTEEDRS